MNMGTLRSGAILRWPYESSEAGAASPDPPGRPVQWSGTAGRLRWARIRHCWSLYGLSLLLSSRCLWPMPKRTAAKLTHRRLPGKTRLPYGQNEIV